MTRLTEISILNIVVSQLYLPLAFWTSLFLSQGHELEVSTTADHLKEVTPLCCPVQVYLQHHRLFFLPIFLISPPACLDVCEKDYFKLNDELFFFFFLSFLSLKTHGYFPKRRLRTCCKNTLALVYEVLRREFVTMASQRSSCSCSTEDNFWLRSSASPGPPAPLPCDYWSPP